MSRSALRARASVGDDLALKLQELRQDKDRGDPPLLRIDQRDEAARAPYQFDSAQGRLHRRGCRAIPDSSRSALYGVWEMGPEEQKLACPHCRPEPPAEQPVDDAQSADLFYGFLSILDQFGSVLRERGREYRKSRPGRNLGADLDGLYKGFGQKEQETLAVVVSALDEIVRKIRDVDRGLGGSRPNAGPRVS